MFKKAVVQMATVDLMKDDLQPKCIGIAMNVLQRFDIWCSGEVLEICHFSHENVRE